MTRSLLVHGEAAPRVGSADVAVASRTGLTGLNVCGDPAHVSTFPICTTCYPPRLPSSGTRARIDPDREVRMAQAPAADDEPAPGRVAQADAEPREEAETPAKAQPETKARTASRARTRVRNGSSAEPGFASWPEGETWNAADDDEAAKASIARAACSHGLGARRHMPPHSVPPRGTPASTANRHLARGLVLNRR